MNNLETIPMVIASSPEPGEDEKGKFIEYSVYTGKHSIHYKDYRAQPPKPKTYLKEELTKAVKTKKVKQ